jgi:hypothetical protein
MKQPETQLKLTFIPNKAGLPVYDKVGRTLRAGLREWQSDLEAGICPPTPLEKLSGNCRSSRYRIVLGQPTGKSFG